MIDRAILLAAGEGQRLRPLTAVLPKCLVPVHGRALLGLWIARLASAGVRELLVNTCHLAEQVEAYLRGSDWPCRVQVVREAVLRGTGGSLIDFLPFWRGHDTLLLHADNLSDIDLAAFQRAHAAGPSGRLATLATFETEVPRECGIVASDASGRVTGFFEKVAEPPGTRVSAAVFALDAALAAELPQTLAEMDFSRDLLPCLVGRLGAWHHPGFHRDLGAGGRYLSAQWAFPQPLGAPDVAWSRLLSRNGGELCHAVVKAMADLAVAAGYRPAVFATTAAALAAAPAADRLAIVLKARPGESSTAVFGATGLRSIMLELEE